jgi:hypothetical protein
MRSRLVVLPIILFLAVTALQARSDDPKPVENKGIQKGMTAAKVIEQLGQPNKIARQVLLGRHVEHWTYEAPIQLRIELRGVRGEETHVGSVHPLRSKKQ